MSVWDFPHLFRFKYDKGANRGDPLPILDNANLRRMVRNKKRRGNKGKKREKKGKFRGNHDGK